MASTSAAQTTVAPVKGGDFEGQHAVLSGYLELSYANGVTAFAGGGQASATQLAKSINVVSTVATAADSVKLPDAVVGRVVIVKNTSANSLNVFPKTGEAINALAADAAYALATVKAALFFCTVAGTWHTILTA
jgi:hypothetical protein